MADEDVQTEVVTAETSKPTSWGAKASDDGVWVKMVNGPTSYSMHGHKFTMDEPVQCVSHDIVNMLLATGNFVKTKRPK